MTQRSTTQALSGTAAALGEVQVRGMKRAVVVISGLSAETIAVTGQVKDTVYTGDLRPIALTTGATETSDSNLANGSFLFDNLAYTTLKFTKSSTSETAVVTVSAAND